MPIVLIGAPTRARTVAGRGFHPVNGTRVAAPSRATGMIGAPVSSASMKTPFLNGMIAPSGERVPSGKQTIRRPVSTTARARCKTAIASFVLRRSISTMPINEMNWPMKGM